MGLVAPRLLELKLFIQQCWKIKAEWEVLLPAAMDAQFRKLIAECGEIKTINFPRYLWSSGSEIGHYELHVFCDASKLSFGCTAYLVHKVPGVNESQLIYVRGRVAPITAHSIPQLELMTTTIGKRAAIFLRKSLDLQITRTVVWTDATTIIQWLHSSVVQSRFVQNRLGELRNVSDIVVRYTPTKHNPADILSRG